MESEEGSGRLLGCFKGSQEVAGKFRRVLGAFQGIAGSTSSSQGRLKGSMRSSGACQEGPRNLKEIPGLRGASKGLREFQKCSRWTQGSFKGSQGRLRKFQGVQ